MRILLLYKNNNQDIINHEYVEYGLYLVLKPLLQIKNLDLLDHDSETNIEIYLDAITDRHERKSFNNKFKQFHTVKHAEKINEKIEKLMQGDIKDFSILVSKLKLDVNMDSWITKSIMMGRFHIFRLLIERFGVREKDSIFSEICHFAGSKFLIYFLDCFPEYMNETTHIVKNGCLQESINRDKLKMVKTLLQFDYEENNYVVIFIAVWKNNGKHQTEILRLLLEDSRFPIAIGIFESIRTGSTELKIELTKILLNDVRAPTSKTDLNKVSPSIRHLIEEDLLKYPTTKIRKVNFPLDQEINQLSMEIDKLENLSHNEENEVFRMGYDIVIENLLLQINELNSVKLFASA